MSIVAKQAPTSCIPVAIISPVISCGLADGCGSRSNAEEDRMRLLFMIAAIVMPSSAMADSCVKLEGAALSNECRKRMLVTVRALRAPGEQTASVYAGENQSFRIEVGGHTTVPGGTRFAIVDLKACQ